MANTPVVRTFGPFVLGRHALACCLCVAALCPSALGDTILARGNYSVPVDKITGFESGAVIYKTPSGREMDKPLRDILQIAVDGQDAFNQAEKLRQEKKTAEAAKLYDAVIGGDAPPWLIAVARIRTAGLPPKTGIFSPESGPAPSSRCTTQSWERQGWRSGMATSGS